MARDPNCVFCKIVAAEIPAAVVYQDENALAFLDVGPLAEGHLLIIPHEHHQRLTDLAPQLCAQIASNFPRLAAALVKVTGCAGFNLLVNQGAVAGQVVPHVHFHIIPRRDGDQLGYRWNAGKYPAGRAGELAAKLQEALARHEA